MMTGKPLPITKRMVWDAYKQVRGNGKAAGVDGQSLAEFEQDMENNLYKLWNRLASGSYFPPAVRRVEIPKSGGGKRPLGIPTVADRIAQMVAKQHLELELDRAFDPDSYGYRPGKSAHQAVEQARQRCWQYDWVLDLDIRGFFDAIDHDLMMRALEKHCQDNWVLLYVKRWLSAPVMMPDGSLEERGKGTPQGGVISPLLANLYLHYAFDMWMRRNFPDVPFERYADDSVCHCRTRQEAEKLRTALEERLAECRLEMHPEKTQVVYCKDSSRIGEHPHIQFTFLGFAFRPRSAKNRKGQAFTGFLPAASPLSLKRMREKIRAWRVPHQAHLPLTAIAEKLNPVLRGWVQYYGRFYPSELSKVFFYLDDRLGKWLRKKSKQYMGHKGRSQRRLRMIAKQNPGLFVHWSQRGMAAVG